MRRVVLGLLLWRQMRVLIAFYALFTKQAMAETTPPGQDNEDRHYADRFVRKLLETREDPECMSGWLDASLETFETSEAVRIFNKCRIVHLRNFFDIEALAEYKQKVSDFVTGIASGKISDKGVTSMPGEYYYIQENSPKRFDVRFPKELILPYEQIIAHPGLVEILSHSSILGKELHLLDAGALVAEPGAPYQRWHKDGTFLFEDSLKQTGLGGHELPPYAIGVVLPLSIHQYTATQNPALHGPTEFCVGSSHLGGFEAERKISNIPFHNETLRRILYEDYWEYYGHMCPQKAWRQPLLEFGDVLLFDYTVEHRGGHNQSPDMARTILYNTYVRSWYKDPNFSNFNQDFESKDEDANPFANASPKMRNLLRNLRYAIPDDSPAAKVDSNKESSQFASLETMESFRPSSFPKIYQDKRYSYMFIMTNIDVAMEGLEICNEDGICAAIPKPGENMEVTEVAGRVLTIVDANKKILKAIKVGTHGRQQQIILDNNHFASVV